MAEVTYILVSEDVFEDSNLGRIISKPYSSLFLPAIPNNFSFAISFGLIDTSYNTDYHVRVSIFNPSGEMVQDQDFIHHLKNETMGPEVRVTCDLTIQCKNFYFGEEGHYKISISLNDNGKSLTLPVYKRNTTN